VWLLLLPETGYSEYLRPPKALSIEHRSSAVVSMLEKQMEAVEQRLFSIENLVTTICTDCCCKHYFKVVRIKCNALSAADDFIHVSYVFLYTSTQAE
jgi:hypothetical protein